MLMSLYNITINKEQQKFIGVIFLSVFIFFIGFKYEVGSDWLAYKEVYLGVRHLKFEFIWEYLYTFFRELGINFYYMSAFLSTISILLMYKGTRKHTDYAVAVIGLFYLAMTPNFIWEAQRSFLAFSIFTLYFMTDSKKKFYTLTLLTTLIHSSLIFTIIIPFLKNQIKTITMVVTILVLIFIQISGESILKIALDIGKLLPLPGTMITRIYYYETKLIIPTITLGFLLKNIVFFILLLFKSKAEEKYKTIHIHLLYNMSFIYIVILYVFLPANEIIHRVFVFYLYGMCYLIILIVMMFRTNIEKVLIFSIFMFYFVLTFFSYSQKIPFQMGYLPYQNLLLIDLYGKEQIDKEDIIIEKWELDKAR